MNIRILRSIINLSNKIVCLFCLVKRSLTVVAWWTNVASRRSEHSGDIPSTTHKWTSTGKNESPLSQLNSHLCLVVFFFVCFFCNIIVNKQNVQTAYNLEYF